MAIPLTITPERSASAPIAVAASAVTVGVLGDLLFHGTGLGINLVLWVAALAIAASWVGQRHGLGAALPDRWLLVAVGFASASAIRDDAALRALNLLAVIAAFGLVALRHGPDASVSLVRDYVAAVRRVAFHLVVGAILLFFSDFH